MLFAEWEDLFRNVMYRHATLLPITFFNVGYLIQKEEKHSFRSVKIGLYFITKATLTLISVINIQVL